MLISGESGHSGDLSQLINDSKGRPQARAGYHWLIMMTLNESDTTESESPTTGGGRLDGSMPAPAPHRAPARDVSIGCHVTQDLESVA